MQAVWTWILAHPFEVCLVALFILVNLVNPLLKGRPKALVELLIDRLSAVTRNGAQNKLSWPVVGRSLFQPTEPKPEEPPRGQSGHVRWASLVWLAGVFILASLVLAACPRLPNPSGCVPSSTRCHNNSPEVCSQTQRWTPVEVNGEPCSTTPGAVCCEALSPRGRLVHACVPALACMVNGDAGTTDAQ